MDNRFKNSHFFSSFNTEKSQVKLTDILEAETDLLSGSKLNVYNLVLENPLYDSLLSILPSVTFIYDMYELSYQYISSNVKTLLGYSPWQFTSADIHFTEELIHPDDLLHTLKVKQYVVDVLVNSSFSGAHLPYQYDVSYRMKHANGTYIHILEQNTIFHLDIATSVMQLLGTYSVMTERSLTGKNELRVHKNAFADVTSKKPAQLLSKREIEIVQLVAQGFSSKQIAEKLFISFHTVNTHRQKIIEKTHCKNTGGLVQYAALHGLI